LPICDVGRIARGRDIDMKAERAHDTHRHAQGDEPLGGMQMAKATTKAAPKTGAKPAKPKKTAAAKPKAADAPKPAAKPKPPKAAKPEPKKGVIKQTTDAISQLASDILADRIVPTIEQIKSVAASALGQDQTKGKRAKPPKKK
jgi:hypothetical protein